MQGKRQSLVRSDVALSYKHTNLHQLPATELSAPRTRRETRGTLSKPYLGENVVNEKLYAMVSKSPNKYKQ